MFRCSHWSLAFPCKARYAFPRTCHCAHARSRADVPTDKASRPSWPSCRRSSPSAGLLNQPVLGVQPEVGFERLVAEVAGVDQKAPLAAVEVEGELGDGDVGGLVEDRADAAVDGVDLADQDDVEEAEVGDDVGQEAFAAVGAEVNRTFQGLVEQRRACPGDAEDC